MTAIIITCLLLVAASVTPTPAARQQLTSTVNFTDRSYTPLSPSRLLDTRSGVGASATGPVGPAKTIEVQIAGRGGVPADGVGAVVFNLTGTQPTASTYITAYPAGQGRPASSTLNLTAGETRPNLAIITVGAGGKVALYNHAGSTHLIADVVGWFARGADLTGLSPARILDTRSGLGASTMDPVGAGKTIDVQVTGRGGVPADGVGAVVFNLTGTQPTASTVVTVFPTGESRPTSSTLNLAKGQTAPNLAVAKVGAGGKLSLYNNTGSTHLIADVLGWMPVGADYVGLSPVRLLDTRSGLGASTMDPVGAGKTIDVQVTGRGGVPADGVGAVVFNLTGTQPTASTVVTVFPTGESRPTSSTLNLVKGQTAPNLVVAKVGARGKVSLHNLTGSTHLIADVVGWISAGVAASLEKPATTEVVDVRQVVSMSPDSDAVTMTGAAPGVGEAMFVPPSPTTGAGILARVTSTQQSGSGQTILRTEPVSLEDAFPSGSISGSADTRALAAGAPASAAKSLAGRLLAGDDGQLRIGAAAAGTTPCAGYVLRTDIAIDVSARVLLDASWGLGKLKRLRVAFELEVAGAVAITAPASVKCSFGVGPSIPLGTIWGFVPSIQPTLKVEFAAGVTDTVKISGRITVGAEYVDGQGVDWIHQGTATGSFTPPTVSATGKLRVAFGPKASLKFARAAGPAFFGGLFAETTLSPTANPWWSTDLGVTVEGSFDVDLWFTQVSYTLAAFDVLRFQLSHAGGAWPGPSITGGELPAGTVGQPYSAPLQIAGGSAPLTTRIASGGLPSGLTLSGTGITGTPTAAGQYRAVVEVTDAAGHTVTSDVQILIKTAGGSGSGDPPPANPAPMWQRQLPNDADPQGMLTHADSALTLKTCYQFGDTQPVLSTFNPDGTLRGSLPGDPEHWPQTCPGDQVGVGPDGTLYFASRDWVSPFGETWRLAAYRPEVGIVWRSPALPGCRTGPDRDLHIGATGDVYLLTGACEDLTRGRHLLGIRVANGAVFLDRVMPAHSPTPTMWDTLELDAYRDGLLVTAWTGPNSVEGHYSIHYYGYDALSGELWSCRTG
ncbi:Ig domain-containing protein [Micromonospora sp. 4G55]|uniref:Ig domain-containing protein n=1 Tax=Micromonospora sp. 4G55 TaxID=2806102 RepID=UPI001A4E0E93|nr:Ig domain-containing protein [Micromonospora sp. 4G55]MBM0255756.1 hypothetical protein [Micromonospora sp. 4G55]